MTNIDQCRAKMESGECPNLLYITTPGKIARCKHSRVWVEDMKDCKLGLWQREREDQTKEAAALRRAGKDPNCMESHL